MHALLLFDSTSANLLQNAKITCCCRFTMNFSFSFFIIIKALKNIADFFSNTYTYASTYYKLFNFQSNLHLRLQTGFYSAICIVVLLQINFQSVLLHICSIAVLH